MPSLPRVPGEPTAAELATLRFIGEQATVPLDQLARFLACDLAEAQRAADRLVEIDCIQSRPCLAEDYDWCWLTRRGLRLSELGFHYKVPRVALLAHRRAVNAVRLYLAHRVPEARWVCEREMHRRLPKGAHVPDAVLEIGNELHAVEVELTRKVEKRVRCILDEHQARYNAIVYFCGSRTWGQLDRLREEGRWPYLRVFELPEGY